MLATAGFALRMAAAGLHGLSVLAFSPYPGSAEYDALAADGRIAGDGTDDAYVYGSLLRSAGGARELVAGARAPGRCRAVQLSILGSFFAVVVGAATVAGRAGGGLGNPTDARRRCSTSFLATKAKQIARRFFPARDRLTASESGGLVLRSG